MRALIQKITLALMFGAICCPLLYANQEKPLTPKVVLKRINVIQSQDILGDELYFDVSVNRVKERSFYQIPKRPIHWPSEKLDGIKDVMLWQGDVKKGDALTLTFSLLDRDINEMNPDDLIGSIQLRLMNKDGVLHSHWSMPNRSSGPEIIAGRDGDIYKFELLSDNVRYQVYFALQH